MRESRTSTLSVVARSPSARQAIARLAGRLGLQVATTPEDVERPTAVLFHLLEASDAELGRLREAAHRSFPSPVIALGSRADGDSERGAWRAGAAGYIHVGQDDSSAAAQLAHVLARLNSSGDEPCPRCPVAGTGEDVPTCLMSGAGLTTGARADDSASEGHWRCFPFLAVSPAMMRVERMARKAAGAGATVLITGESGTGKEVLARYVHWTGARSRRPFVKVHCAALPESLLESELFGYEKGAFSGADGRKPGRFELARGGVILLDEIGELSHGLQAKLLQVLQERRFTPLGGVRDLDVDVQILATTNRDLESEVEAGRFRSDLYFRLKVIELHVPPLRERREDVPVLARHFLRRFSAQYGQCAPELDAAGLQRLARAPWPGNVRELENLVRRAVILGEDCVVLLEHRPASPAGSGNGGDGAGHAEEAPDTAPRSLREVVRRAVRAAEREAIVAALERARWNRTQAARMLGVSYKTLLTKMRRLSV